jgi:indolepyruvate ferredoxin oxidoreductase beta subunit
VRAANVALLGAATHALPFGSAAWERALELAVPARILELNRQAFALGREAGAPTEEGL